MQHIFGNAEILEWIDANHFKISRFTTAGTMNISVRPPTNKQLQNPCYSPMKPYVTPLIDSVVPERVQ